MNDELTSRFIKERTLIGEGKMAKVYLWNGFAYKCFHNGYSEDWITHELNVQNIVGITALPVVKYYESEFPLSIKMEYINGVTLVDRMRKEKYKDGLNDLFNVFTEIHNYTAENLPKANIVLTADIMRLDYDKATKEKAINIINEIPPMNILCHFDYHFLNLMYSEGKYFIIDWISAKQGNPVLDYARTYVITYEFANRLSGKLLQIIKEKCGFDEKTLNKAIYAMAVHRLSEYMDDKVKELVLIYSEKI